MAHRKLFVNLAVDDLDRSVESFTNLGFSFDERFIGRDGDVHGDREDAYAMLLRKPQFAEFTTKHICDYTTHIEAMLAVSAETREAVDDAVDAALAEGRVRSRRDPGARVHVREELP